MPKERGAFLVGLLITNAALGLWGSDYAATCFSVLSEPNAGDALMGVFFVGVGTLAVEIGMMALGIVAVGLDKSRWKFGRLAVLLIPVAGTIVGAVILVWTLLRVYK